MLNTQDKQTEKLSLNLILVAYWNYHILSSNQQVEATRLLSGKSSRGG